MRDARCEACAALPDRPPSCAQSCARRHVFFDMAAQPTDPNAHHDCTALAQTVTSLCVISSDLFVFILYALAWSCASMRSKKAGGITTTAP